MDGQLSWKLGSLLPILSVRVRNEARFIFRTHHPGVTCEPHCHLKLSARSVWTDTHFYMYGNCSFYAQNTASERLDFSRPGFQAPRISAVLWYRPNTSVPVYLAWCIAYFVSMHIPAYVSYRLVYYKNSAAFISLKTDPKCYWLQVWSWELVCLAVATP